MEINVIPQNSDFRFFYKHPTLGTNADIDFSIWDSNGNIIVTADPPTLEILNTGVYYYDVTTPSTDGYWMLLGTEGSNPKGTILKIGAPSSKLAFYLRGDLTNAAQTDYEIFDISNNLLQSGQMTPLVSGFYSVVVSDAIPEPWFLNIIQLVDVRN